MVAYFCYQWEFKELEISNKFLFKFVNYFAKNLMKFVFKHKGISHIFQFLIPRILQL